MIISQSFNILRKVVKKTFIPDIKAPLMSFDMLAIGR